MAMNKFMHHRNPYRNAVDFKKLALEYPEFRKFSKTDLRGKIQFDFKADGAVWTLTKCLLHRDFGLEVETVPSRLVPTLPLRLNYILWLEDLVKLFKNGEEEVRGIDIGTGACCIYPLLASKWFSWKMLSTEVEPENFACAVANVEKNELQDLIKVKKVEQGMFLCGALDEDTEYDFCMCNPPFFNDDEEGKVKNRSGGRVGPKNAHSGISVEVVAQGGEVSFVKMIFEDSLKLKNKVRVYTTMLGHKTSLSILKNFLNGSGAKISSTVFCQGRTTRWGLAWTFDPGIDLDKAKLDTKKKIDEYIRCQDFNIKDETEYFELSEKILGILRALEIQIETDDVMDDQVKMYSLKCKLNTWTKDRRKRREIQRQLLKMIPDEGKVSGGSEEKFDDSDQNLDTKQKTGYKRKIKESNENSIKKTKIDKEESDDCVENSDDFYLHCSLAFKNVNNMLQLVMIYYGGTGGKDAVNQLLQYIKNHVK